MALEARLAPDSKGTSLLRRAIDRVTDYFAPARNARRRVVNDLRGELDRYFVDIDEDERARRASKLEEYVDQSLQRYDRELHGIRKVITKPAMAGAFANDLYSLFSRAPFRNFSAASYFLFGAKTLAEIPSIYRYLKKSHDWYGTAKWAIMKPINYLIPVIGPAIESGLFERIVRNRVKYEARNRFIAAMGGETENQRAKGYLKTRIGDWLPRGRPVPQPALAY